MSQLKSRDLIFPLEIHFFDFEERGKYSIQQECIPVGCILATRALTVVPICVGGCDLVLGGEVVLSRGEVVLSRGCGPVLSRDIHLPPGLGHLTPPPNQVTFTHDQVTSPL